MPKLSPPHPGMVPGFGAAGAEWRSLGTGECSVQIPVLKFSCSLDQSVEVGVFSIEGWKPGLVVISSGALTKTSGLSVAVRFMEHRCRGWCTGQ